jgi:hypothetical protein
MDHSLTAQSGYYFYDYNEIAKLLKDDPEIEKYVKVKGGP